MANISAKLSLNVPAITALCKGEPGTSVLNGTTAPTVVIGNDGDFFIDTTSYQLYGPKTSGIWNSPVQLNNNFLAPKWDSAYNTLSSLSASWVNDNTTVSSNSARWSGVFSTTRAYSGDWNNAFNTANNVYTLVNNESGGWENASSVYTTVNTNSANWNTAYTAINDNSSKWTSTYSSVYANSATWNTTADIGVRALTGNWQNTYSITYAKSAQWEAAASSAGADVSVRALTGNWQNTYSIVNANSGNWGNAYTGFNSQSANNINTYSTVRTNSATWMDVTTTVRSNSGTWRLEDLTVACSDEATDLTVTSAAVSFRVPFDMYLNSVRASVNTAPAGGTIIIDISAANTSIFSTLLSIDQGEDTSVTAAVPAVISNPIIIDDTKMRVAIKQVGSTTPGAGLKVTLKGYRV